MGSQLIHNELTGFFVAFLYSDIQRKVYNLIPDYDHYTPNPERSNLPLETQTNGGYSRFSADA